MSQTTLDVYRDWLGITEAARPLNDYQLLRLKAFEDDAAKIRAHFRKLMAQVRSKSEGANAARGHELRIELTRALLRLTDRRRKLEYDKTLGRPDLSEDRLQSFENILLRRKLATRDQLAKAQKYGDAIGFDLRDALVQQKVLTADIAAQTFADSVGLPFIELEDFEVDGTLIVSLPAVFCRQHSMAPVFRDDGTVMVASPALLGPDVEQELRLRLGGDPRLVICTPMSMNAFIAKHYPREAVEAEARRTGQGPAKAADFSAQLKKTISLAPKAEVDFQKQADAIKVRLILSAFLGFMTFVGYQNLAGAPSFLTGVVASAAVAGVTYGIMKVIGK